MPPSPPSWLRAGSSGSARRLSSSTWPGCSRPSPCPSGRRVAIVSNARGASVLAADACLGAGLSTPNLARASVDALRERVPGGAVLANPLELTWEADADAYEAGVGAVLADPGIDAVIVVYAPPVRPDHDAVASAVAGPLVVDGWPQAGRGDVPRQRTGRRGGRRCAAPPVPLPERGRPGARVDRRLRRVEGPTRRASCPTPRRSVSTPTPCAPSWPRRWPTSPTAAGCDAPMRRRSSLLRVCRSARPCWWRRPTRPSRWPRTWATRWS